MLESHLTKCSAHISAAEGRRLRRCGARLTRRKEQVTRSESGRKLQLFSWSEFLLKGGLCGEDKQSNNKDDTCASAREGVTECTVEPANQLTKGTKCSLSRSDKPQEERSEREDF